MNDKIKNLEVGDKVFDTFHGVGTITKIYENIENIENLCKSIDIHSDIIYKKNFIAIIDYDNRERL